MQKREQLVHKIAEKAAETMVDAFGALSPRGAGTAYDYTREIEVVNNQPSRLPEMWSQLCERDQVRFRQHYIQHLRSQGVPTHLATTWGR